MSSSTDAALERARQPRHRQGTPADPLELNIVAVIPVRRHVAEGADLSEPLVLKTVNAALASKYIDRVIISTDDEDIAGKSESWGAEAPFLRPIELSCPQVRADEVLQYSLRQLESQGSRPDLVVPLECTYPFRPEGLLDLLIDQLLEQELDTVIAGFAEYRPCWCRKEDSLVRVDDYSRIRSQREPVHIGLLSLGCVTYPEFIRRGSRLGERIGIHEIHDPIAAIEIRDREDLKLMETLQHILPQWRAMLKERQLVSPAAAS